MTALLDHPRPHRLIRHETFPILPKNPIPVARDEVVDRVAEWFWYQAQRADPAPSWQIRQHRQCCVGFEIGDAAMDHSVGVGIIWVDAERLRQPRAVAGLDRGETKPPRDVPRGHEGDAARTEHDDAALEDHVIVGPWLHRI